MSIDMAQFHQTFFEESFEGLDLMESGLLDLDAGDADIDLINTIFRAAHSIKGGSGTFGFKRVCEFTHIMETLLDEMRDKRRKVTQEAVNILLQSVDCLRDMLASERNGSRMDEDRVSQIQGMLNDLFNKKEASQLPAAGNTAPKEDNHDPDAQVWHIRFIPFPNLLAKGNDPVRMFRELDLLGELEVVANISNLAEFSSFNPEECYLSWNLTLKGAVTMESIKEIFEWVEDDCELDIRSLSQEKTADAVEHQSRPEGAGNGSEKEKNPSPESINRDSSKAIDKRGAPATAENSSIRVSIDKIDGLINMVGELVIIQSMLAQLGKDFDIDQLGKLRDGLSQLERNTRELQENVMRIRMLPISFAFNRFPRMVHDLSQKMGKQIELKMSGENTELDKTVMEKIVDPLVHLVRNSVDHGVEMPEARRACGKPETGLVHLNAYHKGGNIVIEISDDGAGLNKERILRKAQEKGLIKDGEIPSEEGINELIFLPGFSTAEVVSDVSGRGVGMDVVKKNIQALGGKIEIISREGKGTSFIIRLPLTLAILDGQLVSAGDQIYIIPLVSIIESLQIIEGNVNLIAGKAEVYKLRDEYIPIIRLYDVFNIPPKNTDLKGGLLVVVEGDGKKAGIFIDDLLDQQQVVIKSLETNFKRVEGVSGATILGDGTVALIMDVSSLIRLSHQTGSFNPRNPTAFANSKAA
ncbi:MAG: chemotaxis protein CheA [Pseudomonadota bacterium]